MESEQIGMSGSDSGTTSVAKQGVEEAKKIGSSARRRVYITADEKKAQLFEGPDSWLEKRAKSSRSSRVARHRATSASRSRRQR